MADNFVEIQGDITDLITEYGVKAVFTRLAGKLGTTIGVFGKAGFGNINTQLPDASMVTNETRVLYVPGNLKFKPMPGDDVAINGTSLHVMAVEVYQPATTIIGYKVSLT